MRILKLIATIFSLSLLVLILTACEPTQQEKTNLEQKQDEQKQVESIDEEPESTTTTACIYKDGSCCQGEQGICQTVQVNCEEGKEPAIKGCDEKCEAIFECVEPRAVPIGTEEGFDELKKKPPVPPSEGLDEKDKATCNNQCGNAVCEEIVCLAVGCPCAETAESCPQDCIENEKTFDSTANWKIYTNDLFTLTYPTLWQVKSKKSGVRNTIIFQDLNAGYPGNDYQVLSISYMPNQGGLTLADWWSEESKNSIYTKTGTVKVADIEALKLEAAETEAGPRYVFITDQTVGWIFDLSTTSLDQTIIDQILSTFKLIP